MKFFMPGVIEDEQKAEEYYRAIAKFTQSPISSKRVWKIQWYHNNEQYNCEVGGEIPRYFQSRGDMVLAIFEDNHVYKICTINRGGYRGEPIYASKGYSTQLTYFDDIEQNDK